MMPSGSEMAHAPTCSKLFMAASLMQETKKLFNLIVGSGPTLAMSENEAMKNIRKMIETNKLDHDGTVRVLMIYNCVCIDSTPEEIASDLMKADRENLNLIARYRGVWTSTNQPFNMMGIPIEGTNNYRYIPDSETDALKPYEMVPQGWIAGLGCAYLRLPLDYEWHFCEHDNGHSEDINLFIDTKLRWNYWPLKIRRKKEMWI